MHKDVFQELEWRGMIHNHIPGTAERLAEKTTKVYIGFDPTSDSLHVGSLVPIMILAHLQRAGHTPVALIGGATAMVGDPSGKSKERNLLTAKEIQYNMFGIRKQLQRFLDFESEDNAAVIVNNAEWLGKFNVLDFIRDVGKMVTVNTMMAKESVKKRIETGISFTEFTYQLLQGYDFLHLFKTMDCEIQAGGSDQWGNITTGTEMIRKELGKSAYAFTCPLVTKSDGGKFGKTEQGNVWLDPKRTSPYAFYQFWLNTSDEDAIKYIKLFTMLGRKTIEDLIAAHQQEPHLRALQKELAENITTIVHGEEGLQKAERATKLLFGKSERSDLDAFTAQELKQVFDGMPQFELTTDILEAGLPMDEMLSSATAICESKSDARRALKENSIQVNKNRISKDYTCTMEDVMSNGIILIQRGKKKYFLVTVVNTPE